MRFLIDFDGPVFDVAPAYFAAHQAAAAAVGWSRLDQATFWRLTRTQGRDANVLPGAKPVKMTEYQVRFDAWIESDEAIASRQPRPEIDKALAALAACGLCSLVTLGSNLDARRSAIERHRLRRFFPRSERLDADPRRRPADLRKLGEGDPHTVVVAASDSLLRAAGEADLLTVGLACGACSVDRLHRAGADVVHKTLREFADSLPRGGTNPYYFLNRSAK
jgi:phosphoglycolate phosphatase-like HAD superfamily hydrolase